MTPAGELLARQGCNSARQAYAYRPLRVRSTDRVDQRFHGLLVTAACDGSAVLRSHRPGRNRESWRSPRGPAHRVDPRGSVVGLLTHAKVNNDIEGIVMEATTNVAAATGKPFRYDGEYVYYNWSTKARTQGTYSNARRPR